MAVRKSTSSTKKPAAKAANSAHEAPKRAAACKVFEAFPGPALFTDVTINEIEAWFKDLESHLIPRRALLAFGTKSGPQLLDISAGDREGAEALATVAVCGDIYVEKLRELAELLDESVMRIRIALAHRDDSKELIAAAEREAEPAGVAS